MTPTVPSRKKASLVSQKGLAAVEMALALVVLAPLLLLLVEGAKVLGEYSSILAASREAARMVLRENGDTSGAASLAQSLTEGLDGPSPEVEVTVDESAKTVTVKVDYEYQPFATSHTEGESVFESLDMFSGWDGKLHASTTMPLP
ncbi:TadE/TadG family type IV pilus assembly protein [Desulfolutivibrio sulfoxidireducens]|uniref:TadE/TadG family type IV pilus assembly protein n=1 Tax=Desulfolutivibrio sulfoxidireducens TaxID=2773299 RepID=UPI00159E2403|nr:TadE/TadG family type IV pilus assembly protein [Desulfolutivibrio sulfoxidireducens]